MLNSSITEYLGSKWSSRWLLHNVHGLQEYQIEGLSAVGVLHLKGALLHLLEAQCHHTIMETTFYHLLTEVEGRTSRRTIVVDIVDGYASHTYLVDGPLPASWVSVHVTNSCTLNGWVGDISVPKSPWCSLLSHYGVIWVIITTLLLLILIILIYRLYEFCHAHSDDEYSILVTGAH